MPLPILEFDPLAFGESVRRFRKARKLSLEGAARASGVSRNRIHRIEHAYIMPLADGAVLLSKWTGVDLRDFIVERGETP